MASASDPLKIYKHAIKARPPINHAKTYRYKEPETDIEPDTGPNDSFAPDPGTDPGTAPHSPIPSGKANSNTYTLSSEANMEASGSDDNDDDSDLPISECDRLIDALAKDATRSPSLDRCFQRANKQLVALDKLNLLEREREKARERERERERERARQRERKADVNVVRDKESSRGSALVAVKSYTLGLTWFTTLVFTLALLGVLTVAFLMFAMMKTPILYRIQNLEERMNDKLNTLQRDFPSDKSKFKLLRVAVKAIVLGEPKQPAIVTLLASAGAETITSCFARNLAAVIQSIFEENKQFIHKSGHELTKRLLEPGRIKKDLDDAANGGFSNGSRVFLLENFNVIPIDSAMIFHGLCDDNFAPFKKVFYLFTLNLADLGILSFAEDYELKTFEVTRGWNKDLDENQLSSLESRIGTYKLVIEPEPEQNIPLLMKKWNC